MHTLTQRQRILGTWLVVALLLVVTPLTFAQDDILAQQSETFRQVAKKATPAVVFVEVEKEVQVSSTPFSGDPFDFFGDDFFNRFFGEQRPQSKRLQMGQGSGFVISSDGYILTNNHVVGGADRINVKFSDGRELKAEVIGTDPPSDVALIKVDADGLPTIALGNSDELQVGDWVIAVGNPFGLAQTVTAGIVSANGRSQLNIGNIQYQDFIQTDAAINPGNSGGPLLNLRGEVVGINTAIASRSGGYMGIGFAIPINMAVAIKDQLLKDGSVTRGYLGVLPQNISPDLAESFGLDTTDGVLIAEVVEGTPADEAGLKRGDVIVEFNDQKITNESQFRNLVALIPPGKKVSFIIIRDGKQKKLQAKIGNREDAPIDATPKSKVLEELGMGVQTLTEELAEQLKYDEKHGVVVTQVDPAGIAARAGIQRGTLILEANRQKVTNVEEFMQALADSGKTKKVLLLVKTPHSPYAQFVLLHLE